MIGHEHDFIRPQETTIPRSAGKVGKGRITSSFPAGKICLSFVDGLCAGRTGLMLSKDQTVIGRGEDCDIVLDGETVSREHCEIVLSGAVYLVRDCSRNGTYVNDNRIEQARLRDGDVIRIGQNLLLVHLYSGGNTGMIVNKATTPHKPSPVVEIKPQIVVKGLEEGVTQPFSEDLITIGRRSENHLTLEDDNISRQHVSIERREGRYFVKDLGSANGTFLNETRVGTAQLSEGDRLRIGNFVMTINLLDQDCILNFRRTSK